MIPIEEGQIKPSQTRILRDENIYGPLLGLGLVAGHRLNRISLIGHQEDDLILVPFLLPINVDGEIPVPSPCKVKPLVKGVLIARITNQKNMFQDHRVPIMPIRIGVLSTLLDVEEVCLSFQVRDLIEVAAGAPLVRYIVCPLIITHR